MEAVARHGLGAAGNLRAILWLKWRVTVNSYRRLLRRPRGALILGGLGTAFVIECAVFTFLVLAVDFLRRSGFDAPAGFTWVSAALIPLFVMLLSPSATGVELQTQVDARKLLPYPLRMRELFLGAGLGRALGLLAPVPFLVPPLVAAMAIAPHDLAGLPLSAAALTLLVLQAIFFSQLLTVSFQSSVSSRRNRDTAAFAAVFIAMLIWAALQLWVFGNLGSREALIARISEGNMPPVLAGRVLTAPWSTAGLEALGLLTIETVATFGAGAALSHYFLNVRVATKSKPKSARAMGVQELPISQVGNVLVWKDRIYLRRDPFVKSATYGTLMLVIVAIVSSATTRIADPRQAGGFFLAVYAFLAPWTFLLGLGANIFGVEDGLPFLLATPADRRSFLRAKAVFLVTACTGVGALTLAAAGTIFNRLDLLPSSIAFLFVITLALTASGMISSAYAPSQAAREGFRRKTVSGTGLVVFTGLGLAFLIPVGFASGLPALMGNRWLLLATLPLAAAAEYVLLRAMIDAAASRLTRDEGEVLLRVKA